MTEIERTATSTVAGKLEINENADSVLNTASTIKDETAARFYRGTQEKEGGNYGALSVVIIILALCIAFSRYKNKRR